MSIFLAEPLGIESGKQSISSAMSARWKVCKFFGWEVRGSTGVILVVVVEGCSEMVEGLLRLTQPSFLVGFLDLGVAISEDSEFLRRGAGLALGDKGPSFRRLLR